MDIFSGIDNDIIKALLQKVSITKSYYKKGEIIAHEGERCNRVIRVYHGSVIAKQSFIDGHDNIIKLLTENDYIGINLLFSSNPYYKATFYADTDCELDSLTGDDLLKLMNESHQILNNVLALISDFAISLNDHIRLLSHKTIKSKLAYFLFNEYQKNGNQSFTIAYTKTDLAALLNVERPSLSKELSNIISLGIIKNSGRSYEILDIDRLKTLINE